jgi:hypothetical protein
LSEWAEDNTGKVYGKNRNRAVALTIAHLLTMRARAGTGGAVQQEREGQLGRTYVHLPPNRDSLDLDLTSYGKLLLGLRRAAIFGPRSAIG